MTFLSEKSQNGEISRFAGNGECYYMEGPNRSKIFTKIIINTGDRMYSLNRGNGDITFTEVDEDMNDPDEYFESNIVTAILANDYDGTTLRMTTVDGEMGERDPGHAEQVAEKFSGYLTQLIPTDN
uniref:Uncharacterized protein n=1 Tax=Panagrolaimus sp. JU765 TaxID=591449 RepID=A0AC34QH42_9BILA